VSGRSLLVLVVAVPACALLAPAAHGQASPLPPLDGPNGKVARFAPKPAGTQEKTQFWFGPYVVPPGHDMNRVDIDLPVHDGFIVSVEPGMRRVSDLSEPNHQEGHIHHAHWFALDPGNQEDNYTGGNTEWIFGNGDEETKADFAERSAADPKGPIYGQYVGAAGPQLMIYMLHNKTNQPLNTWIVLDVTFIHGTKEALANKGGRPYHDVSGVLFGRTYDVPRRPNGEGRYRTTRDEPKPIEWTSTVEGTMIGTGGHLHPGGLSVTVENMGSKERPCPAQGAGTTGGSLLYEGDALFNRNVLFSEDFQMEVTHPAWRAPLRKGDRIRITGVYENRDHGWYDVMTHLGIYVDEQQKPRDGCRPYLVGGVREQRTVTKRKRIRTRYWIDRRGRLRRTPVYRRTKVTTGVNVFAGVPNRPWSHLSHDTLCGPELGGPPCSRPETARPPGHQTDQVQIANFLYLPGDQSLSGADGAPPRIKRGTSLTFTNVDQAANIRHSVTTCAWPCNGPYVANYPHPDGVWDSETLGYDPIDGGQSSPVASTPTTLGPGRYAYFCRIHPWMRGAFEVEP
jgi:plastocyanin